MLHVKSIEKKYVVGEQEFWALKGINLSFRQKEFVAILGQSGSGKTTLLNIIGGLDRYSNGDLIIDGVSTKNYKDKDWDTYRNHRIGFVFQSYNLINHLSVLSNVELALTLSGVSAEERRLKATKVLERVGLKDHLNKKTNQLSGGQQQRVAIARALVNDPNIILADEPTGALDSQTSVEIMDLLKEISHDKLIIMVTHNPELAKTYAERIVELSDGNVLSDTNPHKESKKEIIKEVSKTHTSMSFLTALKLSFNNLLTKKVRTLVTALAGSIGIIGVALVLSLQYGVGQYIDDMQEDTFAAFPIQVAQETIDLSAIQNMQQEDENQTPIENGIGGYVPKPVMPTISNTLNPAYLEYINKEVAPKASSISYKYSYEGHDYYLANGQLISMSVSGSSIVSEPTLSTTFLEQQYEIVAGRLYSQTENEAVLVVNKYNKVPNYILALLGLPDNAIISYDNIIGLELYNYPNDIAYNKVSSNPIKYEKVTSLELKNDIDDALKYKIVGIIKTNSSVISSREGIIYNEYLREQILSRNLNSDIAKDQLINKEIDVTTGEAFRLSQNTPTVEKAYNKAISLLGTSEMPTEISFYSKNYDEKIELLNLLKAYNIGKPESEHIIPVDNASSALSMIKTMTNMITAVLIAFAAISLVVSSVMIGIITYTSVLERTKEIGVLRSIGARKKDVSRVFNAETIIIGLIAGTIGVLFTYSVVPIINIILKEATETNNIAQLYWLHALMLMSISILLTYIAGLIPARIASKKDPVVALRSE